MAVVLCGNVALYGMIGSTHANTHRHKTHLQSPGIIDPIKYHCMRANTNKIQLPPGYFFFFLFLSLCDNCVIKHQWIRTKLLFSSIFRLYVSNKSKQRCESILTPLQWCRKVLDHPGPEVELARMTLGHRLDQGLCVCVYVFVTVGLTQQPHLDVCLCGRVHVTISSDSKCLQQSESFYLRLKQGSPWAQMSQGCRSYFHHWRARN